VQPRELSIQFFDLLHQVWIESSDLDASFAQTELAATTDPVVRIKNANDYSRDPSLDDSFDAWELWLVARCARLQGGVEGRPSKHLGLQFLLEQSELRVLPGRQFPAKRLADKHGVARDDSSDLGRDFALLALALTGERHGSLHQLAIINGDGGVCAHRLDGSGATGWRGTPISPLVDRDDDFAGWSTDARSGGS
jgi:hypothetical protein